MTTLIDRTPDWAAELSNLPGHARMQARIVGLHCSLCTGTIEKALGRQPVAAKVAVSLTREQALVDYDPDKISGAEILTTLRDIGDDLYDPRKLRPFEEEEAVLVREGVRLPAGVAASRGSRNDDRHRRPPGACGRRGPRCAAALVYALGDSLRGVAGPSARRRHQAGR